MQPIVSGISYATHNLTAIITPILGTISIYALKSLTIPSTNNNKKNNCMPILDIKSLCTNIPVDQFLRFLKGSIKNKLT